jgi:hypothetical protein
VPSRIAHRLTFKELAMPNRFVCCGAAVLWLAGAASHASAQPDRPSKPVRRESRRSRRHAWAQFAKTQPADGYTLLLGTVSTH